ncbi:hypothetical protein PIB30_069637 [Stylosanthes scabra]|uniref:Beta-galactosidase n=1 Tax=Stylosanthes scabra TaxID=79078 RepID=A0ABU6SND2_9FABA|nr:hypothetical protein [Stylosanthes scabra]
MDQQNNRRRIQGRATLQLQFETTDSREWIGDRRSRRRQPSQLAPPSIDKHPPRRYSLFLRHRRYSLCFCLRRRSPRSSRRLPRRVRHSSPSSLLPAASPSSPEGGTRGNEEEAEVTYDGRSLIIGGHRKILFSGSIHYPRSTPQVFPVGPVNQ